MKRAAWMGVLLLLLGSWQARGGWHGAAFVYKSINGDVALLHPMIAPEITVQLEKGLRQINKGEVLVCRSGTETLKVVERGQEATVTECTLTCGDRVFVVKGIYFEEH